MSHGHGRRGEAFQTVGGSLSNWSARGPRNGGASDNSPSSLRSAHLDLRLLVDQFLGYEGDPHPPARIDREQAAEFPQRQLPVIDDDDGLALGIVLDEAAKHLALRHPLAAVAAELDLRLAGIDLDDGVVPVAPRLLLGRDDIVKTPRISWSVIPWMASPIVRLTPEMVGSA